MDPDAANSLGKYLRDRRTRLDPAAFGFTAARRRTPGLRREEVAQRANISATWYTWLEQGRGGAPSADVLDRIANGLMLTEPEREHLFLLGLGRLPDVRYKPVDGVTPRLQRVLDLLETSPAIIKTATWDVVAWNCAAQAVLTDYSKIPRGQRNVLRMMFGNPRVRDLQEDWERIARFVVGSFRADVARAGATAEATQLVEELSQQSPDFRRMWRDNEIAAEHDGIKRLHHPEAGLLELEFSTFAVDGRPELGMVIYNPVSSTDTERVRSLIAARISGGKDAPRHPADLQERSSDM